MAAVSAIRANTNERRVRAYLQNGSAVRRIRGAHLRVPFPLMVAFVGSTNCWAKATELSKRLSRGDRSIYGTAGLSEHNVQLHKVGLQKR